MCSSKEAQLSDIIDIIIEKLDMGGTVTFTPRGSSMLPMLRNGKDVVVLSKPKGRLRIYDVPLYRRSDGSFVLHRVVGCQDDGSYIMCGDNQFVKEHGIKDSDVIAVMTSFYRKGKSYTADSFSYRAYVSFWCHTRLFRRMYRYAKRKARSLFGAKPGKKSEKE